MKIRKSLLTYMLVILTMMGPSRLMNMFLPYSSYIFMILQCCIGVVFFRNYGAIKKEKESFLLFAFFFVALCGMILTYGTDGKGLIRYLCWMVSLVGLHAFMTNADNEKIKVFLEASRIVYVVGGVLTVFYGLGMTENMAYGTAVYFWGSEAITAQALITFFAMAVYYDVRYYDSISKFSIIMGVFSVGFCIYNNSGQGISMFGVFLILMILNKICYEHFWKIVTPLIILVVITILYYLVITLRFTEINFIVEYITNVLSKEISLTGRDAIFDGALEIFRTHQWIGYGYNNAIINDILGQKAMQFNTAHNSMLQMLVDYGIVGTGVFVGLIYSWMSKMYKQIIMAPKVVYFAIIAMFVGGLVNMVIPSNNFWILIMLGLSNSYQCQQDNEVQSDNYNLRT